MCSEKDIDVVHILTLSSDAPQPTPPPNPVATIVQVEPGPDAEEKMMKTEEQKAEDSVEEKPQTEPVGASLQPSEIEQIRETMSRGSLEEVRVLLRKCYLCSSMSSA